MANAGVISPRRSRPEVRVDVWGALGAAALAGAAYVVALSSSVLPSTAFSIVLFTLAPVFAIFAAIVLFDRARRAVKAPLGWVAVGVASSAVALTLQLISFPSLAPAGGLLSTGGNGSVQLYFLFHWLLAAGVFCALLRINLVWRPVLLIAGLLVSLAAATNLIPGPALLTDGQAFTAATVVAQWVTAVMLGGLTLVWAWRWGRHSLALYSWVGVALSLATYEVLLNALAARRYDSVWWASLSMRVATFGVLAVAALVTVLAQVRQFEGYAESELGRREGELRASLIAQGQLLAAAQALTRAVTVAQVADTVAEAAVAATGATRAVLGEWDEDGGDLRVLAVYGHPDSQLTDEVDPISPDVVLLGSQALRQGQPIFTDFTEKVSTAAFPDPATTPGHTRIRATAALPLRLGSTSIGVLTVSDDQPRDWPAPERDLLAGLADQAAQALQRARLYEREHQIAQDLQRGMLPHRLSAPAGVQLAARYLPGAKGLSVGGDWYDAIPVPGGRTALVVGDVMGKGAQAAAIMGRIRHTIRAIAAVDPHPAVVLRRLDNLADDLVPEGLVTLVYVLLDPATGRVDLARAGHLPPLVCHPDGTTEFIEAGWSRAVGLPPAERTWATLYLPAGSTIVLFTDGLVEHRHDDIEQTMSALRHTLHQHADADPETLIDQALAVRHDADAYDDTCVLLARLATTLIMPPSATETTTTVATSVHPDRVPADVADGELAGWPLQPWKDPSLMLR